MFFVFVLGLFLFFWRVNVWLELTCLWVDAYKRTFAVRNGGP